MDKAILRGTDQNSRDKHKMINVHAKATKKQRILALGCAHTEY